MKTTTKCWLTFEGECKDVPCVWKMARKYPDVAFNIRQAEVGRAVGIMALALEGDEQEIEQAIDYLRSLGVRVDPAEGGDLVTG